MKTKILISCLVAASVLLTGKLYAQTKPDSLSKSINQQVTDMLKDFYTSYITTVAKDASDDLKKLNALKKKYCTKKLIDKIVKDELDYDPIINAQDADMEWLKTLLIKQEPSKANTYSVSYISSYDKTKTTIHLLVIKQDNNYKIDAVW